MAELTHFTQIPIWVDELDNISDFQARLLGFVYTLENTSGTAFPSNKRLAEKYHKSVKTVQNSLSDLYEKGLLKSDRIYKENSKEIEKRFLHIVKPEKLSGVPTPEIEGRVYPKSGEPYPQNQDNPTPEIGQDNISINKSFNKSINNTGDEEDEPLIDPLLAKKMLERFNERMNNSYTNTGLFSPLANQNVSKQEFDDVLNYVLQTWPNPDYLKPAVMVRKFETYLDDAHGKGFIDGKIPTAKKQGEKQEPKMTKNQDVEQEHPLDQAMSTEDMMALLGNRKTHS